jgi:hypothetical protein
MVAQIFGILQSFIIPLPKYMFGRQSIQGRAAAGMNAMPDIASRAIS